MARRRRQRKKARRLAKTSAQAFEWGAHFDGQPPRRIRTAS